MRAYIFGRQLFFADVNLINSNWLIPSIVFAEAYINDQTTLHCPNDINEMDEYLLSICEQPEKNFDECIVVGAREDHW